MVTSSDAASVDTRNTTRAFLVADDHVVTRRGIREVLLDEFPDVEIVEAEDMIMTRSLLETRQWDLILLDVLMPGGNVIDLIHDIRALLPTVPVLILTALLELEYVVQTLRAGANGLIHKHRAAEELIEAVRKVTAGQRYLDNASAVDLASSLLAGDDEPPHSSLSARELDTFLRIARGQSVKEIAADLGISEKTVATYLLRIRTKTGLSNHVEIARYALQRKLVD